MAQWIVDYLPTWNIIRISGIAAYVLLFTGVFLGIAQGMPMAKGKPKATMFKWHIRTTWLAFGLGLVHALTLYIDHYSPFTWGELLIPFTASVHPIGSGLGTLAFYGLVIVLLSSDLRNKLGRKWWFMFHLLSYPVFIGLLVHGMVTGTDSGNIIMRMMYVFTGLSILGITVLRGMLRERKGPEITIGPKRATSGSHSEQNWVEGIGLVRTVRPKHLK
ncbi:MULTISPECIES: ferric reductase-like transmembrane domain-containing protein [unclassified Paenibacillus]|uniref:ferric reductase-like transmembrane domain-containing protein n=1 Tax=unclassified Paenibacillus TaxID=185978 RepID=UPI000882D1C8|nr:MULTISPECIES: ferric reductase-like transmembrane domain-containing protein [unclassified Paenibacillus]WJM07291.1 ferric reductase-like transmembrane domain-containing protein [Paenibacillus sp. PK1-4R]SDD60434.1 Ferric reductase like transmembrane component [Paenibacillus sp. CF095]